MRLLFAGTPEAAVPSLRALVAAGHDVVAVATNPDAPTGRGRRLTPSPVAVAAEELGLEVLKPLRAREPWFIERVREVSPDAAPVVAWGSLIPDSLLDVPRHGWINVHFSLLPAYRGAAPVQRAIMAGDAETGITTFRIVHDLDAGPMFTQVSTSIEHDETSGDLLARLAIQGADVLVSTLAYIEAGTQPTPQIEDGVSLAPKLSVAEVHLDWAGASATQLVNTIRAANPNPGAWTTFAGERLKVLQADQYGAALPITEGELPPEPGTVFPTKRGVSVVACSGVVTLGVVQPQGKKPMNATDWARGARIESGARFE